MICSSANGVPSMVITCSQELKLFPSEAVHVLITFPPPHPSSKNSSSYTTLFSLLQLSTILGSPIFSVLLMSNSQSTVTSRGQLMDGGNLSSTITLVTQLDHLLSESPTHTCISIGGPISSQDKSIHLSDLLGGLFLFKAGGIAIKYSIFSGDVHKSNGSEASNTDAHISAFPFSSRDTFTCSSHTIDGGSLQSIHAFLIVRCTAFKLVSVLDHTAR